MTQELVEAALAVFDEKLAAKHPPVRLLGFGVHNLDSAATSQQSLFDQPDRARNRELDRVTDQIAAKFGKAGIRRGKGMEKDLE